MHILRPKARRVGPAVLVGILLIGGGSAFWFGIQSFRAHARERSQDSEVAEKGKDTFKDALQHLPGTTTLVAFSGGGAVGRATRTFDKNVATLDVLAMLPSIDPASFEYHVWLVKDGLADVVDSGVLTSRADGTWGGAFIAGPATGIVDPTLFSEIVIMLEPRDGNAAPSGMKVCAGKW